jgi:hypothetical protein
MPEWRQILEAEDSTLARSIAGKAVWNLLIEATSSMSGIRTTPPLLSVGGALFLPTSFIASR